MTRNRMIKMIATALVLPVMGLPAYAGQQLNPDIGSKRDVFFGPGLQLDSTGEHVLYVADQDQYLKNELYSVPVDGGIASKVNIELEANDDVLARYVSAIPGGDRVVYLVQRDDDGVVEIYSSDINGQDSEALYPVFGEGGTVAAEPFVLTPDSHHVLYRAILDEEDTIALFAAPIAGGEPVRLTPRGSLGNVAQGGIAAAPNGGNIVFLAEDSSGKSLELYGVSATGGTPVKLSGGFAGEGTVLHTSVRVSPDGKNVFFVADKDTPRKNELYQVPITGGTAKKASVELPMNGDVLAAGLGFTPTGQELLYFADADQDNQYDLYKVAVSGGQSQKVLSAPEGYMISIGSIQPSNDGQHLLYRLREAADPTAEKKKDKLSIGRETINLLSLGTGESTLVSAGIGADGTALGGMFAPDNSAVVYLANEDDSNQTSLFKYDVATGQSTRLFPSETDMEVPYSVLSAFVTPDSKNAVFLAELLDLEDADDQTKAMYEGYENRMNLYSIPLDGGQETVLNGEIPEYSRVYTALITPDSQTIVYTAREGDPDKVQLYKAIMP